MFVVRKTKTRLPCKEKAHDAWFRYSDNLEIVPVFRHPTAPMRYFVCYLDGFYVYLVQHINRTYPRASIVSFQYIPRNSEVPSAEIFGSELKRKFDYALPPLKSLLLKPPNGQGKVREIEFSLPEYFFLKPDEKVIQEKLELSSELYDHFLHLTNRSRAGGSGSEIHIELDGFVLKAIIWRVNLYENGEKFFDFMMSLFKNFKLIETRDQIISKTDFLRYCEAYIRDH